MKLSCDICGRPEASAVVLIEGAKMVACSRCMRSGKVLYRLDDDEVKSEPVESAKPRKTSLDQGEEIVEDAAARIRKAREKTGLKIAVIAEKINETESYIDAIENKRLSPTFEIARKLEKELGVKLIEKVAGEEIAEPSKKPSRFTEPTLGDVVVINKKKKGK